MNTHFLRCGLLILVAFSCRQGQPLSHPEDYFSEGQEKSLRMQIVLKTAPKPEGTPSREEVEAYYLQEANTYQWHFLHEKEGRYYFLISKPAPSLYEKRIGIGGYFNSPDRLHIKGFREVFNMFKMKREDLLKKGGTLFEKMVNGQDLSPYYPNRDPSKGEWIEFPDQLNYYDTLSQSWKTRSSPNLY